jgi:hypothetical protein
MKPETSSFNFSPEQPSIKYGPSIERAPSLDSPESDAKNGAERYEQKAEMSAVASDVGLTSVLPTPVVSSVTVVEDTTIGDTPMVANDDDLIEKEWVDKAKKIVAETRDDPYQREEAVNKLQVDYLKKRYGRELGAAE